MKIILTDYVMFPDEMKEPGERVGVDAEKAAELIDRGLAKVDDELKSDELKEIAKILDIDGYSSMKKDSLIEVINGM